MIYNIVLTFNKETNKEIYDLYTKIKDNLNIEFGLKETSILHITILKFESENKLNKSEIDTILQNVNINLTVDFSGLTLLPSSSQGCWIELSTLKNKQLIEIQNELIKKLSKFKIKSGTEDNFRPHITFVKTINNNIKIKNIDYSILRKKQVKTKLEIGLADDTFEFHRIK